MYPPKPTEALRNLGPILGSKLRARCTSYTLASVASHRAEMEFMLETRCAKKALATSLDTSEDLLGGRGVGASGCNCEGGRVENGDGQMNLGDPKERGEICSEIRKKNL